MEQRVLIIGDSITLGVLEVYGTEIIQMVSPTFVDCGSHELLAMRLWAGFVHPYSKKAAMLLRRPLQRLAGDMAVLGKGEIFIGSPN